MARLERVIKKAVVCLFFGLYMIPTLSAQSALIANRFTRINPTVPTRKEVEKLFGKADADTKGYIATYRVGDDVIFAEYSDGDCSTPNAEWNLPEWTVIEVSYSPYKGHWPLNDVIRKRSLFEKLHIGDVSEQITYLNKNNGISVVYDQYEKSVTDVTLKLSAAQKKQFACK